MLALTGWSLMSKYCGRGVPTKAACIEWMKMCTVGDSILSLKELHIRQYVTSHTAYIEARKKWQPPHTQKKCSYLKLYTLHVSWCGWIVLHAPHQESCIKWKKDLERVLTIQKGTLSKKGCTTLTVTAYSFLRALQTYTGQ